ncbi:MAG: hypothetical protein SGPRY_011465 [Prymnesium sp.]
MGERAMQAEARAAESGAELTRLNLSLLEERRAHATAVAELHDRLSEQMRLRTQSEHELEKSRQNQASAVASSLKKQARDQRRETERNDRGGESEGAWDGGEGRGWSERATDVTEGEEGIKETERREGENGGRGR